MLDHVLFPCHSDQVLRGTQEATPSNLGCTSAISGTPRVKWLRSGVCWRTMPFPASQTPVPPFLSHSVGAAVVAFEMAGVSHPYPARACRSTFIATWSRPRSWSPASRRGTCSRRTAWRTLLWRIPSASLSSPSYWGSWPGRRTLGPPMLRGSWPVHPRWISAMTSCTSRTSIFSWKNFENISMPGSNFAQRSEFVQGWGHSFWRRKCFALML